MQVTPDYWRNGTGGELVPAVERYLKGEKLTFRDVALIRGYLRLWVSAKGWRMNPDAGPGWLGDLAAIRTAAAGIVSKEDIDSFTRLLVHWEMDPW